MITTEQQFDAVVAECRQIFILKMKDYGFVAYYATTNGKRPTLHQS